MNEELRPGLASAPSATEREAAAPDLLSIRAQTWLILRNDLRLTWRELRTGRLRLFTSLTLLGLVFVALQGFFILVCFVARRPPPLAFETAIWFFIAFFMLGAAMNHAVTVLFERADFDLLISSPVSPGAILFARLMGMTLTAALAVAFFFIPALNGAAIGFSAHYLFGYVTWALLAAIVTCAGVWLTLALVRGLGARRARIWVQVVAALMGATVYILFQLQNAFATETKQAMGRKLAHVFAHPVLTLLPRAGRGEWWPLAAMVLLAAVAVTMTARLLGRTFVVGIQDAGDTRTKKKRRGGYTFTEGLIAATIRKDTRLIVRDPLLLSRLLPSVFYLLPVLFPLYRVGHLGAPGLLAPFAVFASLILAGQLTIVAASGEEGWDLIRLSPASTFTLRIAKMFAGMVLPLALALAATVAVALLGRPGLAIMAFLTAVICSAGSSWLEVASIKPTPRKDLVQRPRGMRGKPTVARSLVSGAFLLAGTGGVVLAAKHFWWWAWLCFGVVVIAALACFTLIEAKDIEFEATTDRAKGNAAAKV